MRKKVKRKGGKIQCLSKPGVNNHYLSAVRKHWKRIDAKLRKQNPFTPDLSQINFKAQHWWRKNDLLAKRQMSKDEEKASLIYEAMRRRPEVQQAWLEGKNAVGEDNYQFFTDLVISYLRRSWVELDKDNQAALVEGMHSPFFISPRGYSTFPDTSCREKCRDASFQVLHPPTLDHPEEFSDFLRRVRKFKEAGFLIVAVDNKTNQGVRYAFEGIQRLERSTRKADIVETPWGHLPSDLSSEEKEALEKKMRKGTLTARDLGEVSERHAEQLHLKKLREKLAAGKTLEEINQETTDQFMKEIGNEWRGFVSSETQVLDKRQRNGRLIELKKFDFVKICREIEDLDYGKTAQSDFVQRIRFQ